MPDQERIKGILSARDPFGLSGVSLARDTPKGSSHRKTPRYVAPENLSQREPGTGKRRVVVIRDQRGGSQKFESRQMSQENERILGVMSQLIQKVEGLDHKLRNLGGVQDKLLVVERELLERVANEGRDPDQAFFWTETWQEGEREAEEDILAGRTRRFTNVNDAWAWLEDEDEAES